MDSNNPELLPKEKPLLQEEVKLSQTIFSSRKVLLSIFFGIVFLVLVAVLVFKYRTKSELPKVENKPVIKVDSKFGYKDHNTTLVRIENFPAVKAKYGLKLSTEQEKFLDQNRFLLVDLNQTSFAETGFSFDSMLTSFDKIGGNSNIDERKPEDTKLVTPDIVLHAYHKFFELTLKELEKKELSQALGDFLFSLHENLANKATKSSGNLKLRYQNLEAQVVLARVLFENKNLPKPDFFDNLDAETAYSEKDKTIDSIDNAKKILKKYSKNLPKDLVGRVQKEIDSIYNAKEVSVSPLFSQYSDTQQTDYTQFTPRSHYKETSALRAYFRTMMYLGRSSYFLQKDIGIVDVNLLTQEFLTKSKNGVVPFDSWKKIMAVTGFYAGQSDDLTYTDWQGFLSEILGSKFSDVSSNEVVTKLSSNLSKLKLPKILSDVVVDENISQKNKVDLLRESLAFRIFGQRFTFDAWVLNDLTAGQEQTNIKLPSTPSALFVSAAFGDQQAGSYVQQFLEKEAGFTPAEVTGFLTKLSQKQSDIKKVKKEEWFSSMGSAWMYVLGSLTQKYDTSYPKYMQNLAFLDKQIQTFLGSYTELKHDTLLYAKQSYAEMGGGGEDKPVPAVVKGFVEPNIEFWNRFNEIVSHTQEVFAKNDLFKDHSALFRLKDFQATCNFYAEIAKKEMQNQPITDDEYEKLRTTELSFMAKPFDSVDADENSGKVALIADIHTDAIKGQVLYQATAKPYLMLAIVDNENTPRVVASLVYNHYEFTAPIGGQRLTDEDWKNWVYNQPEKLPAKNFWYKSLLVK